MKKIALALAVTVFASLNATAAEPVVVPPENVSELSVSLNKLSSDCSVKAVQFQSADSSAELDRKLQKIADRQKIQQDVAVYGVGHGSENTRNYMTGLMQQEFAQDVERDKQNVVKTMDETNQLNVCTQEAETAGKSLYSAFKRGHHKSEVLADADSLMIAWLVNIKTVSTGTPYGADEANAAWQRAKTHAELESL